MARYPDIEIYIRQPELADVIDWLDHRIGVEDRQTQGNTTTCRLAGGIDCVLVDNAVTGGFLSVWFKSGDTPWATDEACAREVFSTLGLEVRCSRGSWDEGSDGEEPGWLCISQAGESVIRWP